MILIDCVLSLLHAFFVAGGIASGKSTVSAMFAEMGVPVIDADEMARKGKTWTFMTKRFQLLNSLRINDS